MKSSIWSCDSPDFLITPGIRILETGADTLNSVQASYFERFHRSILNVWTLQTVEHDGNGTRNSMLGCLYNRNYSAILATLQITSYEHKFFLNCLPEVKLS